MEHLKEALSAYGGTLPTFTVSSLAAFVAGGIAKALLRKIIRAVVVAVVIGALVWVGVSLWQYQSDVEGTSLLVRFWQSLLSGVRGG